MGDLKIISNTYPKQPKTDKSQTGSALNQPQKTKPIQYFDSSKIKFLSAEIEADTISEKQTLNWDKVETWIKESPHGLDIAKI